MLEITQAVEGDTKSPPPCGAAGFLGTLLKGCHGSSHRPIFWSDPQPPVRLFCLDVDKGNTLRSMEKLEVHASTCLVKHVSAAEKAKEELWLWRRGKAWVCLHIVWWTPQRTASGGTQDSWNESPPGLEVAKSKQHSLRRDTIIPKGCLPCSDCYRLKHSTKTSVGRAGMFGTSG